MTAPGSPVRRARRLAWIAGAAAVAAVAVVAVLALPGAGRAPPASPGDPAGAAVGSHPDGAPRAADRDAPPGDAGPAAQLLASARAQVAAGGLVEARALLSRAYALDPQPATLLELADVDLQTGRCREARRAVQQVIADGAGALSSRAEELLGRIGRCD